MSQFDYALVEDTQRGKGGNPVVACVSLHHIKAYYGSVDVSFGKPELVATDPVSRMTKRKKKNLGAVYAFIMTFNS